MAKSDGHLDNSSGRNVAVNALLVFDLGGRIKEALDGIFAQNSLAERERRLAAELAYGACRHLITLDHVIGRYSSRPVGRIDRLIVEILRVSLYQMVFLSRTPDFAAVHTAVDQAKGQIGRSAGNFVNAVLRGVQRDIEGAVSAGTACNERTDLYVDQDRACRF